MLFGALKIALSGFKPMLACDDFALESIYLLNASGEGAS